MNGRLTELALSSAVFMRTLLPSRERKFRNEPRMPKNHGRPAHRGHESNDLTEARGFINKIECGGQGLFYI